MVPGAWSSLQLHSVEVELSCSGSCGVKAPQRQPHGNGHAGRDFRNKTHVKLRRVDMNFAEWIENFHGDAKLCLQQIYQALNSRCSARQIDGVNGVRRCGLPEKVKGLLDFKQKKLRNEVQVRGFGIRWNVGKLLTHFQLFGILKAEVQFLLQNVRVLIPPHGNVAREERHSTTCDVDVHQTGANIEQRNGLIGRGVITELKGVLQGKGINIHDGRRLISLLKDARVALNLFTLDRKKQHVQRIARSGRRTQNVIAQIHIREVETNILQGFLVDGEFQFLLIRSTHRDALDNHGMSGNGSGYSGSLNLVLVKDFLDRGGNGKCIHDGAVDDRVLAETINPQIDQFIAVVLLFQLHRLDGTGTDIQADQPRRFFLS